LIRSPGKGGFAWQRAVLHFEDEYRMSGPMIDSKLYAALASAGALPFIACALLPRIGMPVVAGKCWQ
jgi:hypothetical protein